VSDVCAECGAPIPVPGAGSCRDNFHALLALEWDVPDGAGSIAHFYAVSAYLLQHPDGMSYTVESLAWLRSEVARALAGEVNVEDVRQSARGQGERAHITRREGDPVQRWAVERWAMTVADVLAGGVDGYGERVRRWAAAVIADLDAAEGRSA
jgi:uncharacterized protein DUF5946